MGVYKEKGLGKDWKLHQPQTGVQVPGTSIKRTADGLSETKARKTAASTQSYVNDQNCVQRDKVRVRRDGDLNCQTLRE